MGHQRDNKTKTSTRERQPLKIYIINFNALHNNKLKHWFQNIEFAYPWVFTLLILIPVLVYEYRLRHRRQQASMLVTTTHFVSSARSYKTLMLHLPFVLRC